MKTTVMPLVNEYRSSLEEDVRLLYASKILASVQEHLYLYILSRVHSEDVAEDVLQETMQGIFKGLQGFKGNTDEEFWGWCYAIASYKVLDQRKKQKKEKDRFEPLPSDEIWEILEVSWGPKPLPIEDRLDLEFAMNLVEKFRPGCHYLLWSRWVVGLKHQQIGHDLGLKSDTVRRRIDRCLEKARELVAALICTNKTKK